MEGTIAREHNNPFEDENVVKYFNLLERRDSIPEVLNEIFFDDPKPRTASSDFRLKSDNFENINMNIHIHAQNTSGKWSSVETKSPDSTLAPRKERPVAPRVPTESKDESEEKICGPKSHGNISGLTCDNSAVEDDKFEEECSCPICFELFCEKPPRVVVKCVHCSNNFCKKCFVNSTEVTKGCCPLCQKNVSTSTGSGLLYQRNTDMEKRVAHHASTCTYCEVQMSRGELQQHEDECRKAKTEMLRRFHEKGPSSQRDSPKEASTCASPNRDLHWECSSCTFHNHPDLNECEMCQTSKRFSRRHSYDNSIGASVLSPSRTGNNISRRTSSIHITGLRDRRMAREWINSDVGNAVTAPSQLDSEEIPVAIPAEIDNVAEDCIPTAVAIPESNRIASVIPSSPRAFSDGRIADSVAPAHEVCRGASLDGHLQGQGPERYLVNSRAVLVSEGILLMQVPTKKVFRKWKPVRYKLTTQKLSIFSLDHQLLHDIRLHGFMKFGNVFKLDSANVVMKTTEKRRSTKKPIHTARLFQHPPRVCRKHLNRLLQQNGSLDPSLYISVVLNVAMDTETDVTRFINSFSQICQQQKRVTRESFRTW